MGAGNARSAFLMTEPAAEGGAGSDPSMLQTVAVQQGGEWVISGRKAFATGFAGAKIAIIMARTDDGSGGIAATMFRADERRVGKASFRPCRYRGWAYP